MISDRATSHATSDALDRYLREVPRDALLSADEERRLAEAIARGDRDARSRLIQSNLRLVVKIARDYVGRGLAMEDLVGEGNLGLIRAAQEYDPRFGTRFSTYAAYWIKQAIRHALITTTATIRLPAHMVGLLTKWRRAERALRRAGGAAPTFDQIADNLELTASQRVLVERALRSCQLRREGGAGEGGGWSPEEAWDTADAPEAILEADDERRDLMGRLARLDDRERTVVSLRYGLGGQAPQTLKEVGRRLGVTREWVRKIEVRAVQKLDGPAPEPTTARTPSRPKRHTSRTGPARERVLQTA